MMASEMAQQVKALAGKPEEHVHTYTHLAICALTPASTHSHMQKCFHFFLHLVPTFLAIYMIFQLLTIFLKLWDVKWLLLKTGNLRGLIFNVTIISRPDQTGQFMNGENDARSSSWQKERTNFHKLSLDLYTCIMTCIHAK